MVPLSILTGTVGNAGWGEYSLSELVGNIGRGKLCFSKVKFDEFIKFSICIYHHIGCYRIIMFSKFMSRQRLLKDFQ